MMPSSLRRMILPLLAILIIFDSPSLWAIPSPYTSQGIQEIRVRIVEAEPKVVVRGYDLKIYQQGSRLAVANDKNSEWEFRCETGRIRAIKTDGGKSLTLSEPIVTHSPSGFINVNNRPYREEVYIYSAGSFCEVINEVDVEKYLDGLINSEFSAKWPEEAVAAQVVAARTYALYQIRQARLADNNYDVDASTSDQVYDGSLKEDYRASRGVEKTRGLVLVSREKAEPLKAFYHSTCGGFTELPQQVWGTKQAGFKRKVTCPFCAASPRFRWSLDLSDTEIANYLFRGARGDALTKDVPTNWPKNWNDILKRGKIIELRSVQYTAEGRVAELRSVWSLGNRIYQLPISGTKLREWLGPTRLRSTLFYAKRDLLARRWHFEGKGNGHGVGMCQWGAKVMGEKGYKLPSILSHYYPDAILKKFW